MRDLKISLLGTLDITVNGTPIEVASNYVRALLLFLAIEKHRPHRRDVLAEMLWPEKPQGVARNSLKQALSNLRAALGDGENSTPFLLASRDEVQINQSSSYWIDAVEFAELIENCEEHLHDDLALCKHCENALLRAVELSQGDFLADFYLPDNQDFNDWIILKREVFQRQMVEALSNLALIHEARGDYTDASNYCRQLAELEPWNEKNRRDLMRLLALNGMRTAALRQYQICCDSLKKELDVEPSGATVALYEQIIAWDPETFPADNPLPVTVGNPAPLLIEDANSTLKTTASRKPSLRSILFPVIAIVILGIGSMYWFNITENFWSQLPSQITISPIPSVVEKESFTLLQPTETVSPEQNQASTPKSSNLANRGGELEALIALYENTDGPNWENSDGWLSDRSPCEWYGVTCQGKKITKLELPQNQLKGSIPPELGNLSNLTHLILLGNQELSGPLPPELGNLSHLVEMELAHWSNGGSLISGEIPPELGQLSELQILKITTSLLQGPLPIELFELTNLTTIDLPANRLSGPIPPEIGNLINLDFLDLGGNDFSGPIPPELGNLTMLRYLSVGDSLVSGEIPAELGNLIRLRYLVLDTADFSGPLPLTLMNLNLRQLIFFNTNLCEPPDEDFQVWLENIQDLKRTGVLCETGTD